VGRRAGTGCASIAGEGQRTRNFNHAWGFRVKTALGGWFFWQKKVNGGTAVLTTGAEYLMGGGRRAPSSPRTARQAGAAAPPLRSDPRRDGSLERRVPSLADFSGMDKMSHREFSGGSWRAAYMIRCLSSSSSLSLCCLLTAAPHRHHARGRGGGGGDQTNTTRKPNIIFSRPSLTHPPPHPSPPPPFAQAEKEKLIREARGAVATEVAAVKSKMDADISAASAKAKAAVDKEIAMVGGAAKVEPAVQVVETGWTHSLRKVPGFFNPC
jgi:hypothetical protein